MYQMQNQLLADQTSKIVEYDSSSGANLIHRIIQNTLNKGTASYGLRTLSRHGYTPSRLETLALDFNRRGQKFGQDPNTSHPYSHDPPRITDFYVEKDGGLNFDRFTLNESGTGFIPYTEKEKSL